MYIFLITVISFSIQIQKIFIIKFGVFIYMYRNVASVIVNYSEIVNYWYSEVIG